MDIPDSVSDGAMYSLKKKRGSRGKDLPSAIDIRSQIEKGDVVTLLLIDDDGKEKTRTGRLKGGTDTIHEGKTMTNDRRFIFVMSPSSPSLSEMKVTIWIHTGMVNIQELDS